MRSHKTTVLTVPNFLTVIRILLTPIFIVVLLRHQFLYALIIFSFAGVSDALDGFLARYFNQRTIMGAYLDPFADKLLLMSSFITLAMLDLIPLWIAVVIISRDILILMGTVFLTISQKFFEINPSIISKFTTTMQISAVIVTLIYKSTQHLEMLMDLLLWSAALFTILSGLHYIGIGISILKGKSRGGTGKLFR